MTACKYTGTWSDYSGYGAANREFIMALYVSGVNLVTELVVQVPERTNHGISEYIASKLQRRNIFYKIKILHITPDMYARYMEQGKYHIGHLFWETDRLPGLWIDSCNLMNEIWTATQKQADMMKKSGVKVPIYSFPQPIDVTMGEETVVPFEMKYKKDFIFYSIFQWINRKNPRGLLRAYWKAFENRDDVTLILKTYGVNYAADEFSRIIRRIEEWKKELNLKKYPKIYLIRKLMQNAEIPKLHTLGDVYISASSGEGWARPVAEAILLGKPVIAGDNGGITDYLTNDHYFRVPVIPTHAVEQTNIPWYTKEMYWWELKEDELVNAMITVFENRGLISDKVNKSKQWVMENLSYQKVGQQLKDRLAEIERIL